MPPGNSARKTSVGPGIAQWSPPHWTLLGISLLFLISAMSWAKPAWSRELRLSDAARLARIAKDRVFVIYLTGSRQEFYRDRCDPSAVGSPAGLPKALNALSGVRIASGLQIEVLVYCTPSRVGGYQHATGTGDPKILRRTRDLERMLRALADAGVPAEHVFVAGWSAGAWAALMLAEKNPNLMNGVIALAPAFSGPRRTRSAGWSLLRRRLASRIARIHRVDALIYAFHGDAFERPSDLAFIRRINGVRFNAMGEHRRGDEGCRARRAHLTPFAPCFARQSSSILSFMRSNLKAIQQRVSAE